jgi:hypothetical protein
MKINTRLLLTSSLLVSIFVSVGCGGGINSSVQAAAATTPAILSGYCPASNTSTAFMANMGATDDCNSLTGSSNTGLPIPSSGTLQNMRVLSGSTGAVVTVLLNGQPTALTCTVPGSGAFVPGSSCQDNTHTQPVSAGDLVAIQATTAVASSIQGMQVSLEKQ